MGNVVEVEFRAEKAARCAFVRSVESGQAEDVILLASAYRAVLDAGHEDQPLVFDPDVAEAARRLNVAPCFSLARVARVVRTPCEGLTQDSGPLERSGAAYRAGIEMGLSTTEAEIAAQVAGPAELVLAEMVEVS